MNMNYNANSYNIYSEHDCADVITSDWPYMCALELLKYPFDNAVSNYLAYVGKAAKVDRTWMIEYSKDTLRFSNVYEWCREGIIPYVSELQNTPITLIGWLHRYLMKKKAVAVHNIHNLPRTARPIQVEFIRQGDKSVLSIPLLYNEQLCGLIGFDTTIDFRTWTKAEIKAMFQCAHLIANAKHYTPYTAPAPSNEIDAASLIYIKNSGFVRGVTPEEIVGVRSAGNYSEIWLTDGQMILDSRPLSIWEGILSSSLFLRIHRTAFVNTVHITTVDRNKADKWRVKLRAIDQVWSVSRPHRKSLRERIGI